MPLPLTWLSRRRVGLDLNEAAHAVRGWVRFQDIASAPLIPADGLDFLAHDPANVVLSQDRRVMDV